LIHPKNEYLRGEGRALSSKTGGTSTEGFAGGVTRFFKSSTSEYHPTDPPYNSYHASMIREIHSCPEDVKLLVLCFLPRAYGTSYGSHIDGKAHVVTHKTPLSASFSLLFYSPTPGTNCSLPTTRKCTWSYK
ncbi:hypothetical protein HAX54_048041, partial [Datura stramonium]|nr:hypothetical protein [Datura stramonium]